MANVKKIGGRPKQLSKEIRQALSDIGASDQDAAHEKLQLHYRAIKAEVSKLGTEINQGVNDDVEKQAKKIQAMFAIIPTYVLAAW